MWKANLMNAIDYIDALESRNVSFRIIQAMLNEFDMQSARGWDLLRAVYNGNKNKTTTANFKQIYLSQLHFGKRIIYFRKMIKKSDFKYVEDYFEELSKIKSPKLANYLSRYPLPLSEDELEKMSLSRPFPVEYSNDNDFLSLIFTYPRAYKEKNIITIDEISDDAKPEFTDYDELVGIKNRLVQYFDKVIFNKKTGEIRLEIDNSFNLSNEEVTKAEERYRLHFTRGVRKYSHRIFALKQTNIFDKIDTLYNYPDGVVINLEHSTGTGSVKGERMRKKTDDLRRESFHIAGLKALKGNTVNYSISKRWIGDYSTNLILTIPGHASLASSSTPSISHVMIEGCCTENDFNLLLDKVI